MSRQGFARELSPYLIGFSVPRFYLPLSHTFTLFLSLSLSFSLLCYFPQFNFRMIQRVSLLFYFIIFIFSSSTPPLHNMFHFFIELLCCWYLYSIIQGQGEPQIDFIITFYFLGDKLPAHILNAHFVRTSKNFLATEVSLFSMCASVSVCPLTLSFIPRSSSAYATNFSFRLRCVPSQGFSFGIGCDLSMFFFFSFFFGPASIRFGPKT